MSDGGSVYTLGVSADMGWGAEVGVGEACAAMRVVRFRRRPAVLITTTSFNPRFITVFVSIALSFTIDQMPHKQFW